MHDAMFSSVHSNTHVSMTETAKPATGREGRDSAGPMHFIEVGWGLGEPRGQDPATVRTEHCSLSLCVSLNALFLENASIFPDCQQSTSAVEIYTGKLFESSPFTGT